MTHAAIIKVSVDLLAQALALPEGAQIREAWGGSNGLINLIVEHPSLPMVIGDDLPKVIDAKEWIAKP